MRIAIRADAGKIQGTGHVMRCITLAREFLRAGHQVTLLGEFENIEFIENYIQIHRIPTAKHPRNTLEPLIFDLDPDLLIVDSYEIPSEIINNFSESIPICLIFDYDSRGVVSPIYLDHNLGAEAVDSSTLPGNTLNLLGPKYALVRDEIVRIKIHELNHPKNLADSHLLVFFGGTDLMNYSEFAASELYELGIGHVTIVTPNNSLLKNKAYKNVEFVEPTQELHLLIATADAVISAAGSSVLDLGTVGVPTGFIMVAENQRIGFEQIAKLNLGQRYINFGSPKFQPALFRTDVESLLLDTEMRRNFFENNGKMLDGLGANRSVTEFERTLQSTSD